MIDASALIVFDGAALVFAVGAFVWQSRRVLLEKPGTRETARQRHHRARRQWLEANAGGGHDVLAVQTLRNWIMSNTFLASTAILFAMALLAAAFTNDKLSTFAHSINLFGHVSTELWLLKVLLLTTAFLAAFFAFTLSIRSFVHLGFMINTPAREAHAAYLADLAREMENGALHYWIGMRCYYAAALLTLWLFGPLWMVAGTVGFIVLLNRID